MSKKNKNLKKKANGRKWSYTINELKTQFKNLTEVQIQPASLR